MLTLILLFSALAFLIGGWSTGIDNFYPGQSLVQSGAVLLIVALIHTWKKARRFILLLVISTVGFWIFVMIHNLLDWARLYIHSYGTFYVLVDSIGSLMFVCAVFVCPILFLFSVIGLMIVAIKQLIGKSSQIPERISD